MEASTGATRTAARVRSTVAEQAEDVAIALAIGDCHTVLSDSRQAVRNFAKGQICREGERVLRAAILQDRKVRINDASERNENHYETAHAAARALTNRAPATDRPTHFGAKDRMTNYNAIRKAYRLARRTIAPPHPRLSRAEPVLLRQLQTGSLPSPRLMHHIVCRRETADDTHILYDCIKNPEEPRSRMIPPRLETAAKSFDQDQQLWAVLQVHGVIERQGPSKPAMASGDPRRVTATS
ncbi:hypothetical protein HPB49_003093 [Dermacentor silvarum]|uniref:Uncharacterized protein n=1 Tax=Dermacentor silvarum TaxID=543639 RepID=A0ACB8DAH4_DERSI|nr:hypothetical protein HPB49_003093 [Dermacentor silvarum]